MKRVLLLWFIVIAAAITVLPGAAAVSAAEKTADAPVILSGKMVSVCKAQLAWTAVEGATSYEVFRQDGEEWEPMETTAATTATVQGIHKKTLGYTVRAVKETADGGTVYSDYAAPVRVYTRAIVGQACTRDRHDRLGNQTGKELKISNWIYTRKKKERRHYTLLIRMKDPEKAEIVAHTVEVACKSKLVGWTMTKKKRNTFYKELKKVDWNIDQLHRRCSTSCTRIACVAINAAGVKFKYDIDSYNLRKEAKRHRKYMYIITDKSYLTDYKKLKRGDILCDEPHHTLVVL